MDALHRGAADGGGGSGDVLQVHRGAGLTFPGKSLPQCQVMNSKIGKKITPLNYKGSYLKYINLHRS